jgi:hypothetical protein
VKPAVFVSYARKSSSEAVKDLTCALSSAHITSFIDTKQIEPGHEFPAALTAAIEASPVFLAILDPEYTRSWYCIRELACALRSYLSAVEEDAGPDTELFRAGMKSVRRIVVVMSPTAGEDDMIMFPPHIQRRNWPRLDEREMLLGILKARLESSLDRSEGHDDDGGDYKTFNPL